MTPTSYFESRENRELIRLDVKAELYEPTAQLYNLYKIVRRNGGSSVIASEEQKAVKGKLQM